QKPVTFQTSAPLVPLHLRPPARVRVSRGIRFFDCPCGERNLIRDGLMRRPIQCPACDRRHLVEEIQPAASVPPPGSPPAKPVGGKLPTLAGPPRPLRPGEALCPCNEIIPPRTSRSGRNFECAKCGRKG